MRRTLDLLLAPETLQRFRALMGTATRKPGALELPEAGPGRWRLVGFEAVPPRIRVELELAAPPTAPVPTAFAARMQRAGIFGPPAFYEALERLAAQKLGAQPPPVGP